MENIDQARKFITDCWYAGVEAVRGEVATSRALDASPITGIDNILAVGKAASSMSIGALPFLSDAGKALVITKYGHVDSKLECHDRTRILESAHPVPDQNSLAAGVKALDFVKAVPENQNLVVLVSGGASALVELLPDGMTLEQLTSLTRKMLAEGFNITQINAVRTRLSLIKGGKLLQACSAGRVYSFAISDVPADDMSVIGSGIGSMQPGSQVDFELPVEILRHLDRFTDSGPDQVHGDPGNYQGQVIASNRMARNAAQEFATRAGYKVRLNEETMHQDVSKVADMIVEQIGKGKAGIYIWGGEPTVVLPGNPGRGGRNQHLALAVARRISTIDHQAMNHKAMHHKAMDNVVLIVAGTDGTDGPTDAAGGIVDSRTWASVAGASAALASADSGSFLARCGALVESGPTGTNVMDLVIGMKF